MNKIKTITLLIILTTQIQIIAQDDVSLEGLSFKYKTTNATHQAIDSVLTYGSTYGNSLDTIISTNIYTRDKDENTIVQEISSLDSKNKLRPEFKFINEFDTFEKKIAKTQLVWDTITNSYLEDRKKVYVYPVNDVCLEYRYKRTNGMWIIEDSIKTITTYNENQDATLLMNYKFVRGEWRNYRKKENVFDEKNRIFEKTSYIWIDYKWEIIRKSNYYYEPSTNQATVTTLEMSRALPYLDNFMVDPKGTHRSLKRVLYYSMVTKPNLPTIEMVVYNKKRNEQNPEEPSNEKSQGFYLNAGDKVAAVSVFDTNGKLLLNNQVTGTSYIDLNKIGKGNFIVKITIEDKTVTRKLSIK